VILVTKKIAAVSQLETAIELWFRRGDPISIHALATAAHDCFAVMASNIGKPSRYQTWLRSMPETFQARAVYFQNFIKHGCKDPNDEVPYSAVHGEALMVFSALCYQEVFGALTARMHLFLLRFYVEHPDFISADERGSLAELLDIQHASKIEREAFLDDFLPLTARAFGEAT
jgi:hypothetical protein